METSEWIMVFLKLTIVEFIGTVVLLSVVGYLVHKWLLKKEATGKYGKQ